MIPAALFLLLTSASAAAITDASLATGLRASGDRYFLHLERSGRVVADRDLNQYLDGLLVRLQPPAALSVHVIRDTRPLALALPGDRILLSSGLLLRVRDEAELSVVLAHELAHHVEQHHVEQLQTRRDADGSVWNKVPWIGPRRRAAALAGFGEDMEVAADNFAVRRTGEAVALRRVLARLRADAPRSLAASIERRMRALDRYADELPLERTQPPSPRFLQTLRTVRLEAVDDLRLRRDRETMRTLRDDRTLSGLMQHLEDIKEVSPSTAWLEDHPLTPLRQENPVAFELMDGWTFSAPRTWQQRPIVDGVSLSLDGSLLHRIDVRCVAPSRAFVALSETIAEDPGTRRAQVLADLLLQIDRFHGFPVHTQSGVDASEQQGWVQIGYADVRGIEHVVTSAFEYDGAYFREVRWFTPKRHFYARDLATVAAVADSWRQAGAAH